MSFRCLIRGSSIRKVNSYDNFCEESSKMEVKDQEIIPIEVMPNIVLPKLFIKQNFEPCIAKVVCYDAPSYFCIHFKHLETYFDEFMENLNLFYANLEDPPLNTNNLPLCSTWAAFSGGRWHRVIVLTKVNEINGFAVFKMRFVDYGYTKLVSLENVRYLEEQFTYDPPFAVHCSLSQVFPTNKWIANPWSKESLEYFSEFCLRNEEILVIFMKEKSDQSNWEVILESPDGEVVNEELVAKNLAFSSIIKGFTQVGEADHAEEWSNNLQTVVSDFKQTVPSCSQNSKVDEEENYKSDWNPMEEEFLKNGQTRYMDNESAELVLNGFENYDDKVICRFKKYRGSCPRGDACPWSHTLPRKDGLPTGKIPSYFQLEDEYFCPPRLGEYFPALVTTIYSPSKFYIQIPPFKKDMGTGRHMIALKNPFYNLQKRLENEYRNSSGCLTSLLPAIGELLVAYTDKLPVQGYYRVRVVQIEEAADVRVQVFFIDVGNTDWVMESQLRPFYPQFLNIPAQATMCYLAQIASVYEEKWEVEAKKLLVDYISNAEGLQTVVVLEVDELNEDRIGVGIFNSKNEETINEIIKKIN